MSKKDESFENTNTSRAEYSYNTNNQNNNFSSNSQDFKESVNRSLDQTKDNINRSIDESKNQIPRYNEIVNSYQEQSLQTAREISEEYIDAQKEIISSLQSAWRPINENYSSMVTSFASPDSIAKAYTKFVSNWADNAVSAIRLTNNMIFSNLDSWKTVMQQAKDNSRHISNLGVNTAKTFEQNSRQLTSAAKDAAATANSSVSVSTPNSSSPSSSSTDYSSTTTTKKQ